MAIIHRGINQSQAEIDQYAYQRICEAEREHQQRVKNRPRAIRRDIIITIICAAILLSLIFIPGLLKGIQSGVKSGLGSFGGSFLDWACTSTSKDNVTVFLLLTLAKVIVFIVGLLIMILGFVSPLLVIVILFGLPLLVGFVALLDWTTFDPKFNRKYWEATAGDNLPDDLQAKAYGIEAENRAIRLLDAALGRDCHIFTNLRIPYGGKTSETDCIVVTPTSVVVVEVKGHKGRITGDLDDKDLRKQKKDGWDIELFYNPVKQCGTHVFRLGNFLRSAGAHVTVKRCVWFVSDECNLALTDRSNVRQDCPVFRSQDPALFRYLRTGDPLSAEDSACILRSLKSLLSA